MRHRESSESGGNPWNTPQYGVGPPQARPVSCQGLTDREPIQGSKSEPRSVHFRPMTVMSTPLPDLSICRQRGPNAGTAEAEPTAERDAEGGARRFPCPKDVTTSRFLVCVSEGVGEASVTYHSRGSSDRDRNPEARLLSRIAQFTNADGELNLGALVQAEFDLQAQNEKRAHQRAVKTVRQFCVRWSLTKMWTFTFKDEQWDRGEVKAYMNEFLIRWRILNGGKPFPYLYVLELHPEGHGYHVHVAVPGGFFTDFFQLRRVWGHGRIRFDANNRHSGESRNDARRLATYLSKYLSKDLGGDHQRGEHRYEPAQGFEVQTTRRWFPTFRAAVSFLRYGVAGETFVEVWSDYEIDAWLGPPTWLYRSD
jgi:hypothetical protein